MYLTSYYLTVENCTDEVKSKLIADFRNKCKEAYNNLTITGDPVDKTTWYSAERDLKSFSLQHPSFLFVLEGYGEDDGDIWKMYVKDGKQQFETAKFVFNKCKL